MGDGVRNDITVNGGGTIAAGSYENVTINGAGTISGDVVCTSLRMNGAGTCNGTVKAATLVVNGTGNFLAPVQAAEMTVNGNTTVRAGLGVGRLAVKGNMSVDGGVAAHDVDLRGVLKIGGDLTARNVVAEGNLEARDIKVDALDLVVYGRSTAKSVEAARVTLRSPGSLGGVFAILTENRFTADTIRANEVWAEYTTANTVSAGNATIGKGSRIGLVNYSGTCSQVDDAQIAETRKSEPEG